MSKIDYVSGLTERQKGCLPDHMNLEWLEAAQVWCAGASRRKCTTWRRTASYMRPASQMVLYPK